MNSSRRKHHKPVTLEPSQIENLGHNVDPSIVSSAAQDAAHALVNKGRENPDPKIIGRIITLGDEDGFEFLSQLWSNSDAQTLAGCLWRMYTLRTTINKAPEQIKELYNLGKLSNDYAHAIAGFSDPPTTSEILSTVDTIFSGAFSGEFDIALNRFAAFCRILAAGQIEKANSVEEIYPTRAFELHNKSQTLFNTAHDLDRSASLWRDNMLE